MNALLILGFGRHSWDMDDFVYATVLPIEQAKLASLGFLGLEWQQQIVTWTQIIVLTETPQVEPMIFL